MHPLHLVFVLLLRIFLTAAAPPNPSFRRFTIGPFNATVISDGLAIFTANPFNVPEAAVIRTYAAAFRSTGPFILQLNVLVVDTPNARIMVDSGSANIPELPQFSEAGKLVRNMKSAGIDPNSIDAVLLTHGHPDHVAGIRSLNNSRTFPNAKIYISKVEHEYWSTMPLESRRPETLPDELLAGAQAIYLRSIEPYKNDLVLVEERGSPLPGVRFIPTPGHTPGHVAIRFSTSKMQLLATGDSWVSKPDHLENPEWAIFSDSDVAQSYETRIRILEAAARRRELVSSYHEAFPGLGYVSLDGVSFSWTPMQTMLMSTGVSVCDS